MKLWELDVLLEPDFASACSIYVKPHEVLCSSCNLFDERPMLLEWYEGADQIGDFVHCGARWLLKKSVAEMIVSNFAGLEIRDVQFLDHPKLYRPKGRTKRVQVWLPYEGPELVELVFTHRVIASPLSTMRINRRCPECGAVSLDGAYSCEGIETWQGLVHTPRDPQRGIFVSSAQMNGYDVCWVRGTGRRLVTDRVKAYIEGMGLKHIRFLEVGDVIEE